VRRGGPDGGSDLEPGAADPKSRLPSPTLTRLPRTLFRGELNRMGHFSGMPTTRPCGFWVRRQHSRPTLFPSGRVSTPYLLAESDIDMRVRRPVDMREAYGDRS
jgi:hypothetical protein